MSGCAAIVAEHQATTPAADGDSPALRPVLRLSALDLRPLPGAVPCARLHARHLMGEWGLGAIAGDAELVVSELVSNAMLHGASSVTAANPPPVRLRLTSRAREVLIEVWDGGENMPQLRSSALSEDELGGRGLLLVAALASRWGAYRTQGGGKCVFAAVGA